MSSNLALCILAIVFKTTNLLVLSLLILQIAARPFNLLKWIDNTFPKKGQTLSDELKCYALPFGGIGFASHIVTYYTIIMLSRGRSPWLWKKSTHWRFDAFLSVVGLIWTLTITIFTMIRCRQRWEFVVMAFWKMMMSLTLSAISTHAAILVRRHTDWIIKQQRRSGMGVARFPALEHDKTHGHLSSSSGEETFPLVLQPVKKQQRDMDMRHIPVNKDQMEGEGSRALSNLRPARINNEMLDSFPRKPVSRSILVWGWTVLYAIGIIVGYSGLFSLVHQSWELPAVRNLTMAYIIVTLVSILLGVWMGRWIGRTMGSEEDDNPGVTFFEIFAGIFPFLVETGIIAALYSDWILAAIDGNYAGVPDGNNIALTWTYMLPSGYLFFILIFFPL